MNVHGFYEADKKLLTVFSETIDGIKLQQLDKIKLTNQQRAEENGEYTVKQVSSKYTILEKDPTETTKDDLNKYVCVGDPDKRTKQHCESVKKMYGIVRVYVTMNVHSISATRIIPTTEVDV